MRKASKIPVTHSLRQLALATVGFVAAIVLLDSGGLANWANQLGIGPWRDPAVRVTASIDRILHPIGVGDLHHRMLVALARAGWTDDPALAAEGERAVAVTSAAAPASTPATGSIAAPVLGALARPAGNPERQAGAANAKTGGLEPRFLNAPGGDTALAAAIPRTAALAPLPPVAAATPRVVALAGDSMMAVGLSAELMREAAAHKNLRIVRAFKSGTGLTRPEVFNWTDEYPTMIGSEKPDVVLVAIGANDGQGFVVDGKVLPFGGAEWEKVYQQRVADFLAMVSGGGARVVWVGLPPMRVPAYNDKIAVINRICYTVVSQNPRATWWNPVSYVGDENGAYREFVTRGNGRVTRIRAPDGIHLSDEGAGLLTSVLLPWLDPPPPATEIATSNAPAAPRIATQAREPVRTKRRGRKPARS